MTWEKAMDAMERVMSVLLPLVLIFTVWINAVLACGVVIIGKLQHGASIWSIGFTALSDAVLAALVSALVWRGARR